MNDNFTDKELIDGLTLQEGMQAIPRLGVKNKRKFRRDLCKILVRKRREAVEYPHLT